MKLTGIFNDLEYHPVEGRPGAVVRHVGARVEPRSGGAGCCPSRGLEVVDENQRELEKYELPKMIIAIDIYTKIMFLGTLLTPNCVDFRLRSLASQQPILLQHWLGGVGECLWLRKNLSSS